MSETKFTPAPWQWEEIAPEDKEWGACEVWAGETLISSHTNGIANAALIAAAPDLYAALNRIVESVARGASGDVCQTFDFDDARAALAKARGER